MNQHMKKQGNSSTERYRVDRQFYGNRRAEDVAAALVKAHR